MTGDIRAAFAFVGLVVIVAFFAGLPEPGETYSAVYVSAAGDAFIVDHGLSAADCFALPSDTVSCEVER